MKPWKRKPVPGAKGSVIHKTPDCMFRVYEWKTTSRFQVEGLSALYTTLNEAKYKAMKRHDRELRKAAKLLSRYKLLTEHYPLHPEEPE